MSWRSSIDCLDNPKNMLLLLASLTGLPGVKAQGNFRCTYLVFYGFQVITYYQHKGLLSLSETSDMLAGFKDKDMQLSTCLK